MHLYNIIICIHPCIINCAYPFKREAIIMFSFLSQLPAYATFQNVMARVDDQYVGTAMTRDDKPLNDRDIPGHVGQPIIQAGYYIPFFVTFILLSCLLVTLGVILHCSAVVNNDEHTDDVKNGTVVNGGVVIDGNVQKGGTVNGGVVNGNVEAGGTINGGVVNGRVENGGTVNGGVVNGTVENGGTVNGGVVNGTVEAGCKVNECVINENQDTVTGESYLEDCVVNDNVGTGITVKGCVVNGAVNGGIVHGSVIKGNVENNSTILRNVVIGIWKQQERINIVKRGPMFEHSYVLFSQCTFSSWICSPYTLKGMLIYHSILGLKVMGYFGSQLFLVHCHFYLILGA